MENIIFYATMFVWFGMEILLNRMLKSQENDKKGQDKNSLKLIWIAIMIVIPVSIFVSHAFNLPISQGNYISYLGLFFIILGLILRLIIIKDLGKNFTVDVTIRQDHQLKTDGFYQYLRHPSYASSLLSFVGLGLALNNYISLILIVLVIFSVFSYRILVEEKALINTFGKAYQDYSKKTKKLIPFIY